LERSFPHIVLLPGLDGTGKLLDSFKSVLPPNTTISVVAYPDNPALGLEDLVSLVTDALPADHPFIIIAESFSGPIAVRIAASQPAHLAALVMCASFLKAPVSPFWALLSKMGGAMLFRFAPPKWVLRRFMLDADAPDELVGKAGRVVREVNPETLIRRVRIALSVNVEEKFQRIVCPILYLHATHDRLLSKEVRKQFSVTHAGLQVRNVEGAHFLLLTRPHACWKAIERFLLESNVADPQ